MVHTDQLQLKTSSEAVKYLHYHGKQSAIIIMLTI